MRGWDLTNLVYLTSRRKSACSPSVTWTLRTTRNTPCSLAAIPWACPLSLSQNTACRSVHSGICPPTSNPFRNQKLGAGAWSLVGIVPVDTVSYSQLVTSDSREGDNWRWDVGEQDSETSHLPRPASQDPEQTLGEVGAGRN